ncbi:MAG: hypothetical protein IJM76_05710 [Lachnospiraceae bacterium]|nr:hypothetical protein [Lachnospiraceae bacterium]
MAVRRMISNVVIDTDAFLELSLEAQALYFHLNARADDDGFVGAPKTVVRLTGASIDNLHELRDAGFIICFKSGVIAIRDWYVNNFIRKDTYTETIYFREKAMLKQDQSRAYVPCDDDARNEVSGCALQDSDVRNEVSESALRGADECVTQIRLDKDRLDNNNICATQDDAQNVFPETEELKKVIDAQDDDIHEPNDGFEAVWAEYPRKKEKGRAYKAYKARIASGWSPEDLLEATMAYAAECRHDHTQDKYIKHGATFFSATTPFADYIHRDKDDDQEDLFLTG